MNIIKTGPDKRRSSMVFSRLREQIDFPIIIIIIIIIVVVGLLKEVLLWRQKKKKKK